MRFRRALIILTIAASLAMSLFVFASPEFVGNAYANTLTTASTKKATTKVNISRCTVKLSKTSYVYTGKAIKPKIRVYYNGNLIKAKNNYKVKYYSNKNAGTATIRLVGKGKKFTSDKDVKFTITQVPITDLGARLSNTTYNYDGTAKTPKVIMSYKGTTLKEGKDYTKTYSNNTKAGTASVRITGKGNYKSSLTLGFTINKIDISDASVTNYQEGYDYMGSAIKPNPIVSINGRTLVSGTDYTIAYKDNTNVGTATMTITGKGSYYGTITKQFLIIVPDGNYASTIQLAQQTALTYDGKSHKPSIVSVKSRDGKEINSRYYTVYYYRGANITTDFTSAGVITVKVIMKNPYAGELSATQTINKAGQAISAKTTSTTASAADLKKAAKSFEMGAATTGDGALSYKVTSSNNNISFSKGKVTIKKGTAKGTYKIKVEVSAKETTNYNASTKTFTITCKVTK